MKKNRLVIRRARLVDSKDLAGLLGELGYSRGVAFMKDKLRDLHQSKNDRVFVAVHNGQIAGFASCHIMPLMHEAGNLCRVTALVVAQKSRRAKVGTDLMRAVECYAGKSKCGRVEITSGEQRNAAHHFYASLGYQPVSRRFIKVLGMKNPVT